MHKGFLYISTYFFCFFNHIYAQEININDVDKVLQKMYDLIQHKDTYKKELLDIDFLLQEKEKAQGKDKVEILHNLTLAYIYNEPEIALIYNTQAITIAKNINYKKGYYKSRYFEAYLMFVRGYFDNIPSILKELETDQAIEICIECAADAKALKSYVFTEKGEYSNSLITCLEILKLAKEINNHYAYAKAYSALKHLYFRKGNFEKAYEYCLKLIEQDIKLKKTVNFYAQIDDLANFLTRLKYRKKALEVYEFFFKIEKIHKPISSFIKTEAFKNMAEIYLTDNDISNAELYLNKSLLIATKNKYRFRIPRILRLQARLILKKEDTIAAIHSFENSLQAAKEIKAYDIIKSTATDLIELYTKKKDFEKVNNYSILLAATNDSIFNTTEKQKIDLLESKRKTIESEQKTKEQELEKKSEQMKKILIISLIFACFLICIIIVFTITKIKKKDKFLFKKTTELTELKNKFKQPKKEKITIEKTTQSQIYEAIQTLSKEEVFTNPYLTINSFSEVQKIDPKVFSTVLYQEKKLNFTEHINDLRIEHLLNKLFENKSFRESDYKTIYSAVGFLDMDTFNKAFYNKQGIQATYFIDKLIEKQNNSYLLKN